jgi:hypothetical protein
VKDDTILGVVSRAEIEIDQLDDEEHLWECIR